jgi:hypothetical protein
MEAILISALDEVVSFTLRPLWRSAPSSGLGAVEKRKISALPGADYFVVQLVTSSLY